MNLFTFFIGTLISLGYPYDPLSSSAEWETFKVTYNKTYPNGELESMRRNIFTQNKRLIDAFNANQDKSSFTLGINHLADLTNAEAQVLNGLQMSEYNHQNTLEAEQFLQSIYERDTPVPDELDWRNVPGRVSDVKDQGLCGSCWAFSTTGVLEGQEKFHSKNFTGDLLPLSEQNLVDCVISAAGCAGGRVEESLDYVRKQNGIDDEQSYPYEGQSGKCRFNKDNTVISDKGYAALPEFDEQKLKEVVAKYGPVAVAIDASSDEFRLYKKGVFYQRHCFQLLLNHAVLIVGYGTDPAQGDYWIVKNSWGKKFGENGYIRMSRNRDNNCGISTNALIPTF